MNTTTLIIVGMVEIFLIAIAWIHAWTSTKEAEINAKVFTAIINKIDIVDEDSGDNLDDILKRLNNA